MQHPGDGRCHQDAAKQGTAAVFFFQRRADDQEEQHIVEEMFPTGMAQHMAEEPDIEKRIRQGGAVHAEQMGGSPPAGEGVQHQHGQQEKKQT